MSHCEVSIPRPSGVKQPYKSVVIIGPPNSGKSTLFNRLTGLRQKVANYPGVTVEHRLGQFKELPELTLIDLPGLYSLNTISEDEAVSHSVLTGNMPGTPVPDAVLLVLDANSLSRQLVLAASVIQLGIPTMVLLNMSDVFLSSGGSLDLLALARELKAPVAYVSATHGTGFDAIYRFLDTAHSSTIGSLPILPAGNTHHQWAATVRENAQYVRSTPSIWTKRLDDLFLHGIWGPITFLFVVVALFQVVFQVGIPFSNACQSFFDLVANYIRPILGSDDHAFAALLFDGVWKGVTSVLVFLPQIAILFLFIGILEDSGYLARAAVMADSSMRNVGLNGKAFIPLLSAYACAVPAIMATRTIDNKRDRIAAIMIAPFMTCSARLPIYTLLIAAFIPNKPILGNLLGLRAIALLGLYALGFLAALITAKLLKSTILQSKNPHFALELPAYRWPTVQSLGLRVIDRSKVFLVRAGTIILGVSLLVFLLSHLPMQNGHAPELANSYVASMGKAIEPAIRPLGLNWKIGAGLITSLVAREVIVGTLGTIYGIEDDSQSLQQAIHNDLSLAGAVALLVFFAFAMQCTSTLAVVKRETMSWKWPAAQFTYMLFVAYTSAWMAFQVVTWMTSH